MVIIQILKPCNWNPGRIIKPDKDFVKNQDFKNIKFSVKVSDIHKIEKKKKKKKKIPFGLVFWVMKIRKSIKFMYHKNFVKKNMLIWY